jgi:hypothetical protein
MRRLIGTMIGTIGGSLLGEDSCHTRLSRGTRKYVEKQNITLSIPKDVLREAKHLAVDRGVSLSGFLVEALEERVKRLSEMRRAAERQRALMHRGLKLGTKGKVRWTREDLHAR